MAYAGKKTLKALIITVIVVLMLLYLAFAAPYLGALLEDGPDGFMAQISHTASLRVDWSKPGGAERLEALMREQVILTFGLLLAGPPLFYILWHRFVARRPSSRTSGGAATVPRG